MIQKFFILALYANAITASVMGIWSLTMHNILIGIAFVVLAKALTTGEDKSVKKL